MCRKVAPIGCTLRYAAPEVIKAKRSGEREMVLEESLDAWSLGVMAFEMCTRAPAFPRLISVEKVRPSVRLWLLPAAFYMSFRYEMHIPSIDMRNSAEALLPALVLPLPSLRPPPSLLRVAKSSTQEYSIHLSQMYDLT
jgi:serine/threonine protein kinase